MTREKAPFPRNTRPSPCSMKLRPSDFPGNGLLWAIRARVKSETPYSAAQASRLRRRLWNIKEEFRIVLKPAQPCRRCRGTGSKPYDLIFGAYCHIEVAGRIQAHAGGISRQASVQRLEIEAGFGCAG